jgi:hypothetical protein
MTLTLTPLVATLQTSKSSGFGVYLLKLREDFGAAELAIIKPYIELSAATCAFRLHDK